LLKLNGNKHYIVCLNVIIADNNEYLLLRCIMYEGNLDSIPIEGITGIRLSY